MTDSVPDNAVLEKCVKDILAQIKPLEDDRVKRLSVISELENCIQSVKALKGAAVKPFGSFLSDLYSKSGDLDLSIQLLSDSDLSINKKKKQNVLKQVRRALLSRGVPGQLQFIPHARVPVLQYVSNHFDISCDVSVENNAGQIKSKIFYWVNTLDERFGDMVLLIKEWAKAQNINDPKSGSLNSYSLCLLVLFHFQTCQPPILPPLKDIYEGNVTEDTTELASYNEEQINEVCAANIARFRLQNKDPKNESSLCRLLTTFFHKFIHIDAHPDEVISTYTGQFERTMDNPLRMKKSYHLFVEDPVERPDNAARAVSMKGLQRIACAFNEAYRKFDSLEHVDRNELLALLCTPGVGTELGGRVIANTHRYAPERNPQQIRSLGGRGRRDQRFGEAGGLTVSRPIKRNQQANSAGHQTAIHANRAREIGPYENRNHRDQLFGEAGELTGSRPVRRNRQENSAGCQTAIHANRAEAGGLAGSRPIQRNQPEYGAGRQTAIHANRVEAEGLAGRRPVERNQQENSAGRQTAIHANRAEAGGLAGSRPIQRNQPEYGAGRQTAIHANRTRETGGQYDNHNHSHAYMAGHRAVAYQDHYHPQVYTAGYQASPYQNHYHPQVHPYEPHQFHNQLVHNTGARAYQSADQAYTQAFPTAGTYQAPNQQVYYTESQAGGLYQNQPRRNGYRSNHQTHRPARVVKYQPVRGQFDNASAGESRSQASSGAASQRYY